MSRDERRSAIAGPAAVAGGEISPILLTRLVNDVGDNPDQLSILQHALNRTWAEWQRQGGAAAMDLQHYEAVGTMLHALDYHAEKAFGELQGEQQKSTCEKVFQAITDKGTDARGIRRPTSASTLCAITGVSIDELTSVLAAFRKPSRSFVMPPASDAIAPDTVIDISHESLMRVWNRLKTWVERRSRIGLAVPATRRQRVAAYQGRSWPDDRSRTLPHSRLAAKASTECRMGRALPSGVRLRHRIPRGEPPGPRRRR